MIWPCDTALNCTNKRLFCKIKNRMNTGETNGMYKTDLKLGKDEIFAIETDRLRLAVLKKSAAVKVNT